MDLHNQNQRVRLFTASSAYHQVYQTGPPAGGRFFSVKLGAHGLSDVFLNRQMPKKSHWSIAWSDLMMTMFIFFVILYIYQAANREFAIGEPDTFAQPEDAAATLQASLITDPAAVEATWLTRPHPTGVPNQPISSQVLSNLTEDQAVRLILAGDLLFDPGQAALKPRAIQTLKDIAAILHQAPYMVNVVGHTDNLPIHSDQFPTNWELSTLRACQVARFLIEEMKLPSQRFFVTGHAYHQPIKSNETAGGRAANRRVEIIITRTRPTGVDAASIHTIELGPQTTNESNGSQK